METKLENAKMLFQAAEFEKSQQILLELLNVGNTNVALLHMIADNCMELIQYSSAEIFYKQCIQLDPFNATIHLKYADLLCTKLNNVPKAKEMYEKCIELNPKQKHACFKYAKFLYHVEQDFDNALIYIQKCGTELACVNYYHALILSALGKSESCQVQDLYHRAMKIQPNIARYQHAYALTLCDDPSSFIKANSAFSKAMELCKGKDFEIARDYSIFTQRMLHYKRQMQYHHNKHVKLLVYKFDEVITYRSLPYNRLRNVRSCDLGLRYFGGWDRVSRLNRHFQRCLSSPNQVKLVIISHNKTELILMALQRVGLGQYLKDIDIIECGSKSKLHYIDKLCLQYNITQDHRSVLYIDNDKDEIANIKSHHDTFQVISNDEILTGLTLKDFLMIERILGVEICEKHSDVVYCHEITTNLKNTNRKEYHNIRLSILSATKYQNVLGLPVIKYIRYNWKDSVKKTDFINFAKKSSAIHHRSNNRNWTVLNIAPDLIKLDSKNSNVKRQYGHALTYLGHNEKAEMYLKQSIRKNKLNYRNYYEYGIYLFKNNRLRQAEQCFRKAKDLISNSSDSYNGYSIKLIYLALGRTLQWMQQYDRAEYYYQLCTDNTDSKNCPPNACYHYGKFLYSQQRYTQSALYFKTQINSTYHMKRPNAGHYFRFSHTLLKLGDYKSYEVNLSRALALDPFMSDAIVDRNVYNFKCMTKVLNKVLMDNSIHTIEFDRFWFDRIGICNARFNAYYDFFLFNELNDIRYILFERNIENKLSDIMGIDDQEDLEIIMRHVKQIRSEHKEFIRALKQKNMKSKYKFFVAMFDMNAIYTSESFMYYIRSRKQFRKYCRDYCIYQVSLS